MLRKNNIINMLRPPLNFYVHSTADKSICVRQNSICCTKTFQIKWHQRYNKRHIKESKETKKAPERAGELMLKPYRFWGKKSTRLQIYFLKDFKRFTAVLPTTQQFVA